jgi:hypothetical protein
MHRSVADALENTNTYGIIRAYQEQRQVAGQLTRRQLISEGRIRDLVIEFDFDTPKITSPRSGGRTLEMSV